MSTKQIRKHLHEYIDNADERLLRLVYGMFQADAREGDWWNDLPSDLKDSIDRSIDQLERGEGRSHEEVMNEIRDKYLKS